MDEEKIYIDENWPIYLQQEISNTCKDLYTDIYGFNQNYQKYSYNDKYLMHFIPSKQQLYSYLCSLMYENMEDMIKYNSGIGCIKKMIVVHGKEYKIVTKNSFFKALIQHYCNIKNGDLKFNLDNTLFFTHTFYNEDERLMPSEILEFFKDYKYNTLIANVGEALFALAITYEVL